VERVLLFFLLTSVPFVSLFPLSSFSFEEPCYVGRHLAYVGCVGVTQIMLYAIGLPLLVFLFLRRHRDELDKPVVKFRYGLFFSGFSKERYYWEVMVALRKESTVILAVFGPQMGVAMLAHVALLVFMVQILVQLIGHPYEAGQLKLQVLEVTSIVICWGTMWSGFFFYTPRPPSQKAALEFLTMLVVLVNLLYMLVLLFSMCSQCCKEHEDNSVVKVFRKRTTNMQRVLERRTTGGWKKSNVTRRQQHVLNPVMVEIEMTSMELSRPDTLPSVGGGSGKKFKKSTGSNTLNRAPAVVSGGSAGKHVVVEKERGADAVGTNTHRRKLFRKIVDEEHGAYFQDVDTEETVWELPEDGDVVVDDHELQHNPMKRKSFRKIVDEEHGAYFQDVDTEETVWELPEDGDVVVGDHELQHNPMKRKSFRKRNTSNR
jgi:hypothetical protein